jgi:predicted AlkP superfamily phosphohydrolase/phosphomutase
MAVGLDAADRRLLLKYSEDGTMPHLALLRERGAWCYLTTPDGFGDDAIWASFATGVSPAEHSRYFYETIPPGSYLTRYTDTSSICGEPFWDHLARAGRRVAILDVPKCNFSTETSVTQVLDWRCHGRSALPTSRPPELARELLERFGDDVTDRFENPNRCCIEHAIEDGETDRFLADLRASIRAKTEATRLLLERGTWDLFVSVFKESHCVGHQCWDAALLDERPGDENADADGPRQHAVREIYRALDQAVGILRESTGPDAQFMVFSSLGMETNHSGDHLLEQVLERLDSALAPRSSPIRRAVESFRRTRAAIDDPTARERSRRVAFRVGHNEMSGAVRLNVAGREPCGRVRSGNEWKRVCEALEKEFFALVDPGDGRPIVRAVLRAGRDFDGAHVDLLPDMLIVWRRDAPISGARSETVGTVTAPAPRYRRGNHVAGGIAFGTSCDGNTTGRLPDADFLDLAPTFAARLGVKLDAVEGRAIEGLAT